MELQVNGEKYVLDADPRESLLEVLRNRLELTGSKYGCGEGVCGACTVLIDGKPAHSCITPIASAQGKSITTIEGLAHDEAQHSVQDAFLKVDVFQCAYCASGMIISAVALLQKNPKPTREEIIHGMQGNICRCGTYMRIIEAIQRATSV